MRIFFPTWVLLSLGISVLLISFPHAVNGAGFRLPELSIAGLGTADTLVANPDEPGAVPYNPAAMSFHDGNSLSLGLIIINPSLSVTPDGGSGEVESDTSSSFFTPHLYVMHQLASDWSLGLNVNSPFGLETEWPDETFPAFTQLDPTDPSTDIDPLEPSLTKLEMININPNVSYKINTINTGVAAGVDFYIVRDTVLDSQGIKIDGNGSGVGWNVAIMHVRGPFSFGSSYRSRVDVDIDGTFDATGVGSISSSGETELNFPDMWQIGVRYEVLPVLALEFDYEYTGWSSFDTVSISHSSVGIPSPVDETSDWSNTSTYHFGATYQIIPEIQLRLGYAFDNTPQNDDHFTARIPDADRHTFTVGAKYDLGIWALEAGYLYEMFDDRSIDSTTPYLGGDPNGTAAFNGDYEGHAHLFGLGLSVKFD